MNYSAANSNYTTLPGHHALEEYMFTMITQKMAYQLSAQSEVERDAKPPYLFSKIRIVKMSQLWARTGRQSD